MLRNAKDLQGYTIHATDGDIGHVDEFYFDDEHWIIRYLVADAGNWLTVRRVLISNYSIGEVKWDERKIFVKLTREQVKNAPGVETDRPVARQHEAALYDYYGYPYYWGGAGLYGAGVYPGLLTAAAEPAVAGVSEPPPEDSHLQSTHDVTGYHIEAADGEIGHVEDFIIDDENWTIRYIEVDTRNWWPGKKVLLAPSWIQHIDWSGGKVRVNLLREVIQNAPEYDPSTPISRQYEVSLFDHYGQYLDTHGNFNFRYWLPQTEQNEELAKVMNSRRQTMLLKDIMTPNVEVIRPDATLQEAAQKMKNLDVGPIPVCDGERLVGMLTDRDITIRATAEGRDPKTTSVREVMTPEVEYCFEDQSIEDAARLMEEKQIRRLVVLNRDKRLVGIVSLGDVATATGDEQLSGEILEQVSEPS